MLRITAYGPRLLGDLDRLDWPESLKRIQRNWSGPSEGATVDFRVAGEPHSTIGVFTTRPDTLPGATYVVLAPEHPMVDSLAAGSWPADTPREWRYPEGREDRAGARTPALAGRPHRRLRPEEGRSAPGPARKPRRFPRCPAPTTATPPRRAPLRRQEHPLRRS